MANIRVLLAEDDPVCRMLVTRVVRTLGMTVVHASNGQEAQAILDRPEPVDLLLTDIRMPLQDGFALIANVRAEPAFAGLPIICISVMNDRAELERLLAMGVQGYVLKPVDPKQLEEQVREVVDRTAEWRVKRPARSAA